MRYSADHKAQIKEKLIASSAALAKQGGFVATGVDGLMKAVGLSGGAFYGHFPSKEALFQAILARELDASLGKLAGAGAEFDLPQLQKRISQYLSLRHVQQPDAGCVLPALGAEIARADCTVRQQVEPWLAELQRVWGQVLQDEQLALVVLSQCVGALMLARMLADPQRQEEVLLASRLWLSKLFAEQAKQQVAV